VTEELKLFKSKTRIFFSPRRQGRKERQNYLS
jgi:hypothetical protein